MAKNDWARNAFRKAQNLMSRGYNDFEPATVVTKNDLSNLKNTLLDDEQIYLDNKKANNWTDLDSETKPYPAHLESNPILDAAEDALGKAGVTHAFTEEPEIEVLSEVPDATSWDEWYETFSDPESPAITQAEADKGKKLGVDTIKILETKLISDPNLNIGEKVDIGVKIQSIKSAMKELGS